MKWIFIYLVFSSICMAQNNIEKAMNEAKKLGAEQNKRDVSIFREKIKEDIHYPSEDSNGVPQAPETSYYKSGNMEDASMIKSKEGAGKLVREGSTSRPQYTFDGEKDPIFKRYKDISEKSHSLTETYSGCRDLPVGIEDVTKTEQKSCHVFGSRKQVNYSCQLKLDVTCKNPNAGSVKPFHVSDFNVSGDSLNINSKGINKFNINAIRKHQINFFKMEFSKTFISEISFYIDNLRELSQFDFESIGYDDWLDIEVNGNLLFRGIGPNQGTHLSKNGQKAEHNKVWWGNPFSAGRYLSQGWNKIKLVNLVADGGRVDISIKFERTHLCEEKDDYRKECSSEAGFTDQNLVKKTCVKESEYRRIMDFSIYRPCWEWREDYTALAQPEYTKEPRCNELVKEGCSQIASLCEQQEPSYCSKQKLTYSCPYLDSARHVILCGDVLQCPDGPNGNCAEDFKRDFNKDNTEDFKHAATGLAVASEFVKNINHEDINTFKGRSRKCGKTGFGASNCCKESGWAQDLSFTKCNADEKELGLARELKKTIYVGSYTSGGEIDKRKYEVYCVYSSKLARIIVEQGKKQKGKSFGSPKSPDCSGFTLQELESLNFENINFGEFYSDVMDKAKSGSTPTGTEATIDIQRKIKNKLQKRSQ